MPIPEENPTTEEGIRLGRLLFYDPILSGDSTQSCATCHVQENAFADPRRVSIGIDGSQGTVNAPGLVNSGWNEFLFWNGRAQSLEEQALEPVPNPIEMKLPWEEAEDRLNAHPHYPRLFEAAFGTDEITRSMVVMAIAQFERTMTSGDTRFDRWDRDREGNADLLTEQEKRGYDKYMAEEVGDCFHCHGTDGMFNLSRVFENNGLDATPDPGLAEIVPHPSNYGKFRAPTIRNLLYTAPYMHDGRFQTLEEVLDHYSSGLNDFLTLATVLKVRLDYLRDHPELDELMTEQDKQDIIAFLKTLSDPDFVTRPDLSNPFEDDDPFGDS
jgi:cytochrome c peroxidase